MVRAVEIFESVVEAADVIPGRVGRGVILQVLAVIDRGPFNLVGSRRSISPIASASRGPGVWRWRKNLGPLVGRRERAGIRDAQQPKPWSGTRRQSPQGQEVKADVFIPGSDDSPGGKISIRGADSWITNRRGIRRTNREESRSSLDLEDLRLPNKGPTRRMILKRSLPTLNATRNSSPFRASFVGPLQGGFLGILRWPEGRRSALEESERSG